MEKSSNFVFLYVTLIQGYKQWPVTGNYWSFFAISKINFFQLFGEFLLECWLSNFQFCVEMKPVNCHSSVSTSAAPSLDIKESILV